MAWYKFVTINYIRQILHYLKKKIKDWYLFRKRRPYLLELCKYIDNSTSIISSNCFAGRIMQDLHMQYNSPTLGLYFWASDYIEFLSNLKYYLLEAKLTFVSHSKYSLGDERRENNEHWYPIGVLDEKVEIHFLHYYTEQEAKEKWERRARRVDFNKLLIVGMQQNLCSEQCLIDFDKLPYKNKIFFSTHDVNLPSICAINEFSNRQEVGNPYLNADLFYKYLVEYLKKQEG